MTQILTKWVVITGAPSSGKTSIIEQLSKLGYRVVHEVARAYIRRLMRENVDIAYQRSDKSIQDRILSLKQTREQNLDAKKRMFFDRGMPDSLAYYRLHHLPFADIYKYFYTYRYEAVFFLEPLPLVHDDIRTEPLAIAQKLNHLIYQSYIECDYDPVRVPVMSIQQRTQFILEQLGKIEKHV